MTTNQAQLAIICKALRRSADNVRKAAEIAARNGIGISELQHLLDEAYEIEKLAESFDKPKPIKKRRRNAKTV